MLAIDSSEQFRIHPETRLIPAATRISASVVTYNNSPASIAALCRALRDSYPGIHILVVDNASSPALKAALQGEHVEYIACESNVGFGRAHNVAFDRVKYLSTYHFVVNPDIEVFPTTLRSLVAFLDGNPDVGAVMPKVLCPDLTVQRQCKQLPSPLDLALRRFAPAPLKYIFSDKMARYDLCHLDYNALMEPPVVCGCFLGVRLSVINKIGGFDPRFFMYMEDFDLCRRIRREARLVYYPAAIVIHEHGKGSYRHLRLLRHHVSSAVRYFNKWGWLRDVHRERANSDHSIRGNVVSLNLGMRPLMSLTTGRHPKPAA